MGVLTAVSFFFVNSSRSETLDMSSYWGEMTADMLNGKLPLASMGAELRVPRAPTRERGPPSA